MRWNGSKIFSTRWGENGNKIRDDFISVFTSSTNPVFSDATSFFTLNPMSVLMSSIFLSILDILLLNLLSKKRNHQSMMAAHLANLTPIVKSKTANKRQRVGSNTCPKCDVTLKQEQECNLYRRVSNRV
jgi:uncharacterized paraquat-inducible protein A